MGIELTSGHRGKCYFLSKEICTVCSIVRQGHKSLLVASCNNLLHISLNKEAERLSTMPKVDKNHLFTI